MTARDNRTGEQRRADLRASVADTLARVFGSDAVDRSARAVWAAVLDVSGTHIDNCITGAKALHVADLLAAPQPVRHAIAQLVIGEGHCIAEVPPAVETPDDLRVLAKMVREHNAAVEALVTAMADGHVTSAEAARIVSTARGSLAATAAVLNLGLRGVANRGLKLAVSR